MKLLKVPYFWQLDNPSGNGDIECYSSTCAMLAADKGKVQTDDEYCRLRERFGYTTDQIAQIKTLEYLGLKVTARKDGCLNHIHRLISDNTPVAVGWLHKGYVSQPMAGGHWSVIAGYTEYETIHLDPFAEADMVWGGYVNYNRGKEIKYSNLNWLRRWMVEGEGTGWYSCTVIEDFFSCDALVTHL